ncbi:hypothetical protein DAPPUDRAFT_303595 [Daphnia pulex]|uniref:Large ribosomal subunit protein mL52 n=1 Tax=Daphnia pulex TaxID=6669 RepID=E9GHF4_DAPPU|nr:hypothetical protein DAPPUDRAFT_303595 [Daphnia pulex]|eukprot:EFX81184.1 hypothetical protein DAPPUDRAFT_303595 [Daphnia pulex]
MAAPTISRLAFGLKTIGQNGTRSISTSYCCLVEEDWRYKNGMPRNPNAYGPLTDGRDFTFVDGRPTPVNSGQRRRLEQNKLHAEKIIQIVKEMNFAVERNRGLKQLKEEKRREILDTKLKPKGHLLLSKDK